MARCILALDQGTTSSRAILFGHDGRMLASAQQEFEQILPGPGLVEHEPAAIWISQLAVAREALAKASVDAADVAALGLTNQRETTILWHRDTGRPVANAIVWQSRVSADICDRLKADGLEDTFHKKTGLVVDPYFSGTKIKYLLDRHDGLRASAQRGEVLFGTVDSWLLWNLSGGRLHLTDPSNASRTLLFNIHTLDWDDELLEILDVPRAMLPEVRPSSEVYGQTDDELFGRPIPIAAMIGDQQAATFGQGCFQPGMAKNTYGTGCFLLMNTGQQAVLSENRLLTTIGWSLNNQITYCLEGSVFVAGAVVQWLRDGLGIIQNSAEVEELAARVPDADGVYFVPAFVGLGAPHWDPYARGAIVGISRGTTAAHLARAAVDSMAFQTCDLVDVMQHDAAKALGQPEFRLAELRVDGGAAVNDQLMQFQADLLDVPLRRPIVFETTALGTAYLAGLAVGFWNDLPDVAAHWALDREFTPTIAPEKRTILVTKWREAVRRALAWQQP